MTKSRTQGVSDDSIGGDDAGEAQEPKKPRSLLSYISIALSSALLILVVALGAVLIVIPKLAGAIPLTVLTQSMEPTLPPGTLIVDRPIKAKDVRIGDVVTYQIESGEPDVITHRVVGINFASNGTGSRTFTFKGDNNAVPDTDQVVSAQIQGKVWYSIPLIGYVSLWMNGPARAIVVPIAAGALFLFALWMFISGINDSFRKKRQAKKGASQP